jgi:hypothetical protein
MGKFQRNSSSSRKIMTGPRNAVVWRSHNSRPPLGNDPQHRRTGSRANSSMVNSFMQMQGNLAIRNVSWCLKARRLLESRCPAAALVCRAPPSDEFEQWQHDGAASNWESDQSYDLTYSSNAILGIIASVFQRTVICQSWCQSDPNWPSTRGECASSPDTPGDAWGPLGMLRREACQGGSKLSRHRSARYFCALRQSQLAPSSQWLGDATCVPFDICAS